MTNAGNGLGTRFVCLLGIASALSLLGVMAWLDALDFDPCDNGFKHPSVKCLQPGIAGEILGLAVIMLGATVAWGALRNGRSQFGNWAEPLLLAWIGICMCVTGAAVFYVGLWEL